MRTLKIGLCALAGGIGVVAASSAIGQDNNRIWCEPIPPNRLQGFELDLRKRPDGICPIGFVAVVSASPAVIARPVSASGD